MKGLAHRGSGLRRGLAVLAIGLTAAFWAAPASGVSNEVRRIQEKCIELRSAAEGAEYDNVAEGKPARLTRIYKDFDYILKANKNEAIRSDLQSASDPVEKDRLERLDDFLLYHRIRGAVSSGLDNTIDYFRTGSLTVPGSGKPLTLRNWPILAAEEEERGNRRIWYLASRQLMENANVFLLNLQLDLNRASQEIAGKSYPEFIAGLYGANEVGMTRLAETILASTEAEYRSLLEEQAAAEFDGMAMKDFRAYDAPRLFRFASLDKAFPGGKAEDTAARWLRDFGINLKDQKYLRIQMNAVDGKSPTPESFPIDLERNIRVSVYPIGGMSDYWDLFQVLGEAQFYEHIDPSLPFEHKALGNPLLAATYGQLFQGLIRDEAWRSRYLKIDEKDAERIEKAVRLRQLHDLRRAAGQHLFQLALRADPKVPPSKFAEQMQAALGWSHTSSEETGYLEAEDYYGSGIRLQAAALAEQMRGKLESEYGPQWWADPQAGSVLKSHWQKGFTTSGNDLAQTWGFASIDAAPLCGPGAATTAGTAPTSPVGGNTPEGEAPQAPTDAPSAPGSLDAGAPVASPE